MPEPVTPLYEGAQYALERQVRAVEEVLAGTDGPPLTPRLTDAMAVVGRIDELRNNKPDRSETVAALAVAGPKRFDALFEKAVEEMRHRQAVEAVLSELTSGMLWGAVKVAMIADYGAIASRIRPVFDAAVEALSLAAADLVGDDPIAGDAAAILEAGVGAQWRTARQETARIIAVAQVFDDGNLGHRVGDAARKAGGLVPVVHVDDVGAELVHVLTATPVASVEDRAPIEAVRNYATAVFTYGPAAGLLQVARGDHPGIRLALVTSDDDIRERCRRLTEAHLRRTADMPRPKKVMLRR